MRSKLKNQTIRTYVNHLEETVPFWNPQWMGIDEIHIIRKTRGVISNIELDMLPGMNAGEDVKCFNAVQYTVRRTPGCRKSFPV